MIISKKTALSEIQDVFHDQFPHLRIAFYKSGHGSGEGSAVLEKIEDELLVGDVTALNDNVTFELQGEMQISAFEQHMLDQCGLNVQVFRRSGNLWLQTITTDNWTLDEANRKGGRSRDLYRDQHNT